MKKTKSRWRKIFDAVKNMDEVYEGIKNKLFKKHYIERIADYRWSICKDCDLVDIEGKSCVAPGTEPCCSDCGCSLGFKLRAMSTSCPKGHWPSYMSSEEEDRLLKVIGYRPKDDTGITLKPKEDGSNI